MSSSAKLKYKHSTELAKLHAKLMMSSQWSYIWSLSSHLSEA